MAKSRAALDQKDQNLPRKQKCFFYIGPEHVALDDILTTGFLPLTKKNTTWLNRSPEPPSKGDSICIIQKIDARPGRYTLVAICEALGSATVQADVSKRIAGHLSRKIDIGEMIARQSPSQATARFDLNPGSEFKDLPQLLSAKNSQFSKAKVAAPLFRLNEQLRDAVTKANLSSEETAGHIFDPERSELCKISELISRTDLGYLQMGLERRPHTKEGYEMITKIHQQSLRAMGSSLRDLDWQQFEDICVDLAKDFGFDVQETKRTGDGGIDIYCLDRATPFRKGLYVIQCKQKESVGVNDARQFDSSIREQRAAKGIIWTTGRLTADARRFCEEQPSLEYYEGFDLAEMFKNLGRKKAESGEDAANSGG